MRKGVSKNINEKKNICGWDVKNRRECCRTGIGEGRTIIKEVQRGHTLKHDNLAMKAQCVNKGKIKWNGRCEWHQVCFILVMRVWSLSWWLLQQSPLRSTCRVGRCWCSQQFQQVSRFFQMRGILPRKTTWCWNYWVGGSPSLVSPVFQLQLWFWCSLDSSHAWESITQALGSYRRQGHLCLSFLPGMCLLHHTY